MSTKKNTALSYDQVIALYEIYLSDWQYRNNLLWSQVFKLFYISIFIITLPILSGGLGYNMPLVSSLLFPIVGLFSAIFSYYVAIGYSLRLKVAKITIDSLIEFLPPNYRPKTLLDLKYGQHFIKRQTIVIPTVFFCVEIIVAIIMIYCIKSGLMH